MPSDEDPIASRADDDRDLYDVATWEERTSLDGLSVALYWLLTRSAKAGVVLVAFVGLLAILGSFGLGLLFDPAIAVLLGLSVIPALGLAAYVYVSDVTTGEPLSLLVATFLLSILTATFAAILNSVLQPYFRPLGFLGIVVFFFVVVGPIEESVKLLAVRLYAYTDARFDAVIDGAVYGAIAGLGFVVIENFVYIAQNVDMAELTLGVATLGAGDGIAALRVDPGEVKRHRSFCSTGLSAMDAFASLKISKTIGWCLVDRSPEEVSLAVKWIVCSEETHRIPWFDPAVVADFKDRFIHPARIAEQHGLQVGKVVSRLKRRGVRPALTKAEVGENFYRTRDLEADLFT